MNKQEEKLRALQMTLEELDNTIQVTKFEKKRKVELENGLFLDPKIYDLRNVEDFNLRFERNLAIFKAQNPTKTTREFINNEIEKINNIEAEIKRISQTVSGVICIEKCFIRKAGMKYHVDLHVMVEGNKSVKEGHDIAHVLKDTLREQLIELGHVLIHIEPNFESIER